MRKLYLSLSNNLHKKVLHGLTLLAFAFVLQLSVNAQSVWNGSISSDVLTTDNWTPAITITNTATTAGPHLSVPRTPVLAGNLLYIHPPIISGAANYTVRSLGGATVANAPAASDSSDVNLDGIKEYLTNSSFIVNLDEGYTFTVQNGTTATGNANWYPGGSTIVRSGKLATGRPIYLTADSQRIIAENKGIFQTSQTCVLGSNNGYLTSTNGGRLIARGNGKIILGGWNGRTTDSIKGPQIFVTENGTIEITGQIDFNPHIRKVKITGAPDYYPVTRTDAGANRTYIWAVPNNQLRVAQTIGQILTAGQNGTLVSIVQNQAWKDCDPASFEWKYSLSASGPYVAFSVPVKNDSIIPNFSASGTLYLVCQATKISDGSTMTSDAVKCVVGSGKLVFSPSATQYLRVGQSGATITVTETGTSTDREWKYATVSGGPYSSFAVPEKGITYTPAFAVADTFFVQLESTIDGNVERGKEIMIINDTWTAGARTISWLGTTADINSAANWNPIAHIHRNTLTIPTGVANMPTLTSAGNDTISSVLVQANTVFTVNKPSISDTLDIRNDNQTIGDGEIRIESGVIKATAGLRCTTNLSKITLKGNSSLFFATGGLGLSMGNAATVTAGGKIIVAGNGLVKHDVGPYRVSANKADTFSRTFIKEQGQVWYKGDQYNQVYNWTKLKKVLQDTISADTIAFLFDVAGNYTKVWAFDTTKFSVYPYSRVYAGQEQKIQYTAKNTTGLTNLQWLYRLNAADGKVMTNADAWTPIAGANSETAEISFSQTGEYFVTCVGIDGATKEQRSLNVGKVKVVAIDIVDKKDSVAKSKVYVLIGSEDTVLVRTAPVKKLGEWKWSATLGSGYQSFDPVQTDSSLKFLAANLGAIYVVYETTVDNDDAVPVVVTSKPIEIEVVETINAKELAKNSSAIFPNPNNGEFSIKTGVSGSVKVQLIDITGKVVYNRDYNQSGNINMNFARKGTYVVKVITAKGVKINRLVVK